MIYIFQVYSETPLGSLSGSHAGHQCSTSLRAGGGGGSEVRWSLRHLGGQNWELYIYIYIYTYLNIYIYIMYIDRWCLNIRERIWRWNLGGYSHWFSNEPSSLGLINLDPCDYYQECLLSGYVVMSYLPILRGYERHRWSFPNLAHMIELQTKLVNLKMNQRGWEWTDVNRCDRVRLDKSKPDDKCVILLFSLSSRLRFARSWTGRLMARASHA